MRGWYREDWEIDPEYESPARTVKQADIVAFADIPGDPLHMNEGYRKTTGFGTRVAHGSLVYAVAAALLSQRHRRDDILIAFSRFEDVRLIKPVKIGATVHA